MRGNSSFSVRPAVLRLSFACDLREVRTHVKAIHEFLAEHDWAGEDLMSFDLALVEGCNNAVKYCGEEGRKYPIELEVNCDEAQVEFRVRDHTAGFEWPKKIELPASESENGRGLYLIKSVMDHASYFRGRDGNVLVMRKGRSTSQAKPPANEAIEQEGIIHSMVEELSSCYESLSAIFRYSNESGRNGSLKEFTQRLGSDLLQIIGAEWFVLRLVPRNESRLVVYAASEPALELPPLPFPATEKHDHVMELEVAAKHQRVWFGTENHFADDVLLRIKPGTAGLVYPILHGEQFVGTLALGKAIVQGHTPVAGASAFTAAQTHVVSMLADFLAIQITNARALEEQVNRRLVTHELGIAKDIQRSLLPPVLPQLPGFSLAGFCRSAHEVGGDFYDVLKIDDYCSLLIIADVMGKGIPAAMFAAILRSLLRATPELTREPAALLTRVNRLLYADLSGVDMFITAQLAFVDSRARTVVTASAGHCPLALAQAKGVKTFSPEGMPLGILADTTFQDETIELPLYSRLLLYTDGLSDALNMQRQHFSQERLMEWLQQSLKLKRDAEHLKAELVKELDAHQTDAGLSDDQTFLILAS